MAYRGAQEELGRQARQDVIIRSRRAEVRVKNGHQVARASLRSSPAYRRRKGVAAGKYPSCSLQVRRQQETPRMQATAAITSSLMAGP